MPSLAFAKLVATPTDTAWSQVYNAGNLFASLSLSKKDVIENGDPESLSLHSLGKDIFSQIEAEFFTLEEKNLDSIKEALHHATKSIPETVDANLCLVYFKNNILYVFISGLGSVIMKRGEKTGVLLTKNSTDGPGIVSSSGLLENGDTIVLQTPQFAKDMPLETVSSALELNLPNDIAEALSPAMHEKDGDVPRSEAGGQAAIIINYQGSAHQENIETPVPDTQGATGPEITTEKEILEQVQEDEEKETELPITHYPASEELPRPKKESLVQNLQKKLAPFGAILKKGSMKTPQSGLNHRNKLFLSIAVLILIVLVASVILSKKREEERKTTALFASIYEPALNNYEDGLDVKSINEEFARGDFQKAEKILKDGKGKFKKGTKEEKQINELLGKVQKELGGELTATETSKTKEVSVGKNEFLSVVRTNPSGVSFAKDADSTYFITDKSVTSISKTGTRKEVLKNNDDWENPAGVAFYQGNVYVLDSVEGVLKFTPGAAGFGKSSYLRTKPAKISEASAMTIDGSIWVLFKDGAISKFTRGVADDFKITRLTKPMKSPSKIYTNLDMENLYVLDSGNSRIIKLSKEGAFQSQYNAGILKSAKEFEVNEAEGKILILSNGKTWELPL